MNFDEAIEKFEQEANEYNGLVPMETVYELILDLKEEYAPTVEMTKEHRVELLMMRDEQDPLVEILADLDGRVLRNDFDRYWDPLTEKQVVQVWLRPETIVVTDSE